MFMYVMCSLQSGPFNMRHVLNETCLIVYAYCDFWWYKRDNINRLNKFTSLYCNTFFQGNSQQYARKHVSHFYICIRKFA